MTRSVGSEALIDLLGGDVSSCQCEGIELLFDQDAAELNLEEYREVGPAETTSMLVEALLGEEVLGSTLLDIGGGVGAIQHALLEAGADRTISVEASTGYHEASRKEAERRGLSDRMTHLHGNFVDLAPDISPADIVALDRVICCFDDMEALVSLSAERAKRLYALVYPRDRWWVRIGFALENVLRRLQRIPFRTYVHPTEKVETIVRERGLERRSRRTTWEWQVVVYRRVAAGPAD
ncbi:MAG: methyltransferase domain-containing protein [Anaerolineae bacterium]